MRIAVVQHALRSEAEADADALVSAATDAAGMGADVVVLPEVRSVHADVLLESWWQRIAVAVADTTVLVPHVGPDTHSVAFEAELEPLGRVALLTGDAAIDADVLAQTVQRCADAIILSPRSESDIQAEAVLELAIGLSLSAASLVLVVDVDGAPSGEAGHGGSAIVHLGEVMAEAGSGDDILVCDIEAPLVAPSPRAPLPIPAPILAQRLATHQGRKVDVSYPAELS